MKVFNFQFNDFKDFEKEINRLKKTQNPDLFIVYCPYSFFESENFHTYQEAVQGIKDVAISAVATIKDDSLKYNSFGGIAFKFEKNAKCEIVTMEDISEDIKRSSDFIVENIIDEDKGTNLLFSTSSNLAVHSILMDSFKEKDKKVRLYGGVASSNAPDFRTYISVNGNIIRDGFVLLKLFNVESFNTISLGFIPIGTTYMITKGKENKIYFLDDIPVHYFLTNILKNTGIKPEDLDPVKTSQILWEFPFLFIDEEGYVSHLLVPMYYDTDDQGLAFYGKISEGDKIKLSTGDSEDILIDVKLRAEEFKSIVSSNYKKPDIIMNITCTARNYILKEDNLHKKEQEIYYSYLSDYKMTGFLTFGEIGPDRMGKPGKFYNETSILVGMLER